MNDVIPKDIMLQVTKQSKLYLSHKMFCVPMYILSKNLPKKLR